MEWVLGIAGLLVAILTAIWQWVIPELTRVRTAVLAAEPSIECTIGSYGGAGSGINAGIHNTGQISAHDLSLSVSTFENLWRQHLIEPGAWARPQIPLPATSPLLERELEQPTGRLTYKDRFGLPYVLTLSLTQTRRDDGRFNLGSRPPGQLERPTLTRRTLWRLRKEV